MRKKFTAAALAAVMVAAVLPAAAAAETPINNTVAGYISLTEGVKLAGTDKAPVVYVDADDYSGVVRAAGDLAEDIETVTGVQPTVTNEITITENEGGSGITISENGMSVTFDSPVDADADCYIAAYDKNGALNGVVIADGKVSSGDDVVGYSVGSVLEKPSGGELKAFIWRDMEPIYSVQGMLVSETADLSGADVVIGTIGESTAVDALISSGELDVSAIEGEWESFTIQNIDDTVVIAGSDKRGTIYGIYNLCEKIGVSPWSWWADATPVTVENLYVNLDEDGYTELGSSVKYRGIFINDEYNLNQWSESLGDGNMNIETYERIYELVLRLKANTLWPAMHAYSNGFHTNPECAALADEYGVVMGSSHAEPLLRNNLSELDDFQDEWEAANPDKTLYKALTNESGKKVAYYWTDKDYSGNAVDNKEFLEAYWRESVQNYGGYENIYMLGMRGMHDGSFQTNMDYATALNEIIAVQRKILQEEVADVQGIALEDIPQVFIPYKDIQSLYNSGSLVIPDDVTIMWTDDNYGYMRQNADDAERERSGGTGVYYHVSYYGWPTSYLWLSSTQPGLIREELSKSYNMGADKVWILNVGDLKPAEKEIEYFTRLARDIDGTVDTGISEIYASNAKRDFNMDDETAAEYADIMDAYYELANSKRPEFFRTTDETYGLALSSTAYGDEAERYLNKYEDICSRAEALYDALDEDKRAAFFELALYPIRSAKNMAMNYIQTARAELYAEQGRGAAAYEYAAEASAAVDEITSDIEYYNSMLDGKWNKMANMNPSKLQSCDAALTLNLGSPEIESLDYTELAVMTDSQTEYSDNPTMTVSVYDSCDKFIDVINLGYGGLEYTVTADTDALVFDKTSGTSYGSDRVRVYADADKAAAGVTTATITVSHTLDGNAIDTKEITVTIENPTEDLKEKTYVEAGGVVSIEAEHYSDAVSNGDYEWRLEEDFGRSGDSMKAYPDIADTVAESDVLTDSAYLEYNVYFTNAGTYTLDVYRMPTLDERGSCRFAVSADNGTPTVLKGTSSYPSSSSETKNRANSWANGVLANSEKLSTTVTISEAGYHTIRIYNMSPGVVIDKLVLHTDSVSSYFGAPESYNTTYNTERLRATTTTESAPDESETIAKTFEPSAVITAVSADSSVVTGASLYRIDDTLESAVIIAAAYDAGGNVINSSFAKAEFTDTTADVTLDLDISAASAYAVYAVDSLTDLQPIAPYKVCGDILSEAESDYISLKTDFSEYYGIKSLVLIADCEITDALTANDIVYVYGETLTKDSYKYIPFAEEQGKYYIRAGVAGGYTFDETKNTVVNIYPDTEASEETLDLWTFDEDLYNENGENPFTLSGGASLSDGTVKMNTTSTGTLSMDYDTPVVVSQGQSVTVEFDITFGKLTGKTLSYDITDSAGNTLVSAKLHVYNVWENTTLTIGDTDVLGGDYTTLSNAISKSSNTASGNNPTHFKYVIDFAANRAYLTVSASGTTAAEYSAKLSDNVGDAAGIHFSTTYNNEDRACYVDNVEVSLATEEQYKITFAAEDSESDESIENAEITVKDGASGAVIAAEEDGTYLLCEGDYTVTAAADGYRDTTYALELTPALESKNITIPMQSSSTLTAAAVTIKFTDENGAEIADSVTIDDCYVGDSYSVPDEYLTDIKRTVNGKTSVYRYSEEDSVLTSSALTEDNTFTVVCVFEASYDYYEDFENYTLSEHTWNGTTSALAVSNGYSGKGLLYTSSGSTIGAYESINAIDCTDKTATVEADVKFAPSGTAGNSQFVISGSTLTFLSSNIDYGIDSSGHILALEYNTGSTLLVNGNSVTTDFIGSWIHIKAVIDFSTETMDVTLTNDSGTNAELTNIAFYSSGVTNIGSYYVRAAKTTGTVAADNISVLCEE
ncbi:MAG: glycosyl hydrolase 115 family protein [Oscillospiraceae bacterium]|nr:glycosyl hydrolase 115 family protein [Oscillospiraceae bacterium]